MRLMTKELERALGESPLYSSESSGAPLGDLPVVAKYFCGSAATWLVCEGRKKGGDWLFWGLVTLGLRDPFRPGCLLWEWGYFTLSQLEAERSGLGLGVERDLGVRPGRTRVRDEAFMCHPSVLGDPEPFPAAPPLFWAASGPGQQTLFRAPRPSGRARPGRIVRPGGAPPIDAPERPGASTRSLDQAVPPLGL